MPNCRQIGRRDDCHPFSGFSDTFALRFLAMLTCSLISRHARGMVMKRGLNPEAITRVGTLRRQGDELGGSYGAALASAGAFLRFTLLAKVPLGAAWITVPGKQPTARR
jgi:hypothetical protein